MRTKARVVLVLFSLAPMAAHAQVPPPEQPAGPPLTLAQAIARALSTSPRIEAARSGVTAARADRKAAAAERYPDVSVGATAAIQRPEVTLPKPIPTTVPPPPGSPPGTPPMQGIALGENLLVPKETVIPELRVLQQVYTGGRIHAQKLAAKRGERAALARLEAEGQRLVLDVTDAYLTTLEARQQVDLASAVRRLTEERLAVSRVRQRAGVAVPLEVSQLEADLAQAVQREIDTDARMRQAGATLNTLMGRPAGAALVLANLPATTPAGEAPAPAPEPLSPDRLRALGLERPELRALREDVKRANAEVDAARAARRPQVFLNPLALLRIPETVLGGFAWSIGGSILQSLFDGGRRSARVDAARAERSRRTATLAEGERQMEEQVEQARVGLDAAEKLQGAEERRAATAAEALAVTRVRFRAGTIAPFEVTEAETTLARAQTDEITARFEVARARVRLAFVTGVAHPESVPRIVAAAKN